ncbi:MAG TPA: nucleotidyl transferase AbiEii/AbiGii toxin family protein [Capsulimonadaceae bacterium]|jgi:predicted nucleotidyltransferase component of viral defense system
MPINRNTPYYRQVQLLIRVLRIVSTETCFALKGGTAINLFVRDLPRLSVDIDLVFLPLEERTASLRHIREALGRIAIAAQRQRGCEIIPPNEASDAMRLFVIQGAERIKIELSPVLRGSVFPPKPMATQPSVELEFGFVETQVLTLPDLYAGKICAALDRQHPRDLFDIKLLLENEGITREMRQAFLVYLIGHNRPMSELLAPTRKDIRAQFNQEFADMTSEPVTLAELEDVREQLIANLMAGMTEQDKEFLLSFKRRAPNWQLLGLTGIERLPAVRWKLLNLDKMPAEKHAHAVRALETALQETAKSDSD